LNAIDRYLAEVGSALQVRGAARRRFLRECRDHLLDAAAESCETQAVRSFGPPREIAAAFDREIVTRRGVRAASAAVAGIVAIGASTLVLINSAAPLAAAPTTWTVTFFVAAQVAAVCAVLTSLQALAMRRLPASPADVRLLSRRGWCGLVAAGVTMFSAAAGVPGQGPAALLLGGPVLACLATVSVLRSQSLARRIDGTQALAVRSPLDDLRLVTGLPVPSLGIGRLLALTTCFAAAAAFIRDRAEHASASQALLTAGIEALAVVACFAGLGRALALWRR
jgi:uncharacterized membrane protein